MPFSQDMAIFDISVSEVRRVLSLTYHTIFQNTTWQCLPLPDLEIVQSVSGNLNVFTEKILRNGGLYGDRNSSFCVLDDGEIINEFQQRKSLHSEIGHKYWYVLHKKKFTEISKLFCCLTFWISRSYKNFLQSQKCFWKLGGVPTKPYPI